MICCIKNTSGLRSWNKEEQQWSKHAQSRLCWQVSWIDVSTKSGLCLCKSGQWLATGSGQGHVSQTKTCTCQQHDGQSLPPNENTAKQTAWEATRVVWWWKWPSSWHLTFHIRHVCLPRLKWMSANGWRWAGFKQQRKCQGRQIIKTIQFPNLSLSLRWENRQLSNWKRCHMHVPDGLRSTQLLPGSLLQAIMRPAVGEDEHTMLASPLAACLLGPSGHQIPHSCQQCSQTHRLALQRGICREDHAWCCKVTAARRMCGSCCQCFF